MSRKINQEIRKKYLTNQETRIIIKLNQETRKRGDNMSSNVIASTVKKIISDRGLKQYVVAEKCGYTRTRFNDLLNGRKLITEQDIFKLCDGLEVTPNELFGFGKSA